ncbi:unnamed protein product [marine sediment metagenome]|uniref:Uncharacterized protein n=1 Tax=marine sediment metagenome TaxID=412755 RepID=X0WAL4_9ZZZZ
MRIQVRTNHPQRKVSLKKIKKQAEVLLEELGQGDKELSILLVDNDGIRELNSSYRGMDEPTDVLAFSQIEGGVIPRRAREAVLGDVVISLDKAEEMADRFKRAMEKEVLLYLIHGVLHLVGFEHAAKSAAFHRMHKKERRLLEKIWKRKV